MLTISSSIAAIQGLPSIARDDYVTLEASAATPGNTPSWLAQIPQKVIDTLRIARLDDRVSQALGNSILSPSGQPSATSTTSLFSVFLSELNELERNIKSRDPATTLRLHLCRMRMCSFELQSKPTPSSTTTRALAATDCYVSCMRIAEAACTTPRDEIVRWPYSLSFGYSIACVGLPLSYSEFRAYIALPATDLSHPLAFVGGRAAAGYEFSSDTNISCF